MKTLTKYATLVLALLAFVPVARAETIYGITFGSNPALVAFDSATPGTSTVIGSTGVANLAAIDFRPANGLLYGLGFDAATLGAQLYTINISTGVATPIGAAITLTGSDTTSSEVSIDFNPVPGLIRVVTSNGTSYRVNPDTGALLGQDTTFAYAAGDLNVAENPPSIAGVAYSNNFPGATTTTLYAYDFNIDVISSLSTPGNGQMTTVGGLDGPAAFTNDIGFDISGVTGIAYVTIDEFNSPTVEDELYTIDLTDGSATLVGVTTGLDLLDISVAPVPEPATVSLMAIGLFGLAFAARRRRRR